MLLIVFAAVALVGLSVAHLDDDLEGLRPLFVVNEN